MKTTFKLGATSPLGLSYLEQNLLHEKVLLVLLQLLAVINTSPGKKGLMNGEEAIAV